MRLATGPKLVIRTNLPEGIDVVQNGNYVIDRGALKSGVIFISSDLSEVVSICDRVTVIKEGKAVELTGGDGRRNILWT